MDTEAHSIIGYAESEFRTFPEKPLCDVDSLIFSQAAYFHWSIYPKIPKKPSDTARRLLAPKLSSLFLGEMFPKLMPEAENERKNRMLMAAICANPRFRDVRVVAHESNFDEKITEQFSATTFLLPDGSLYIAFRGTDASYTAWKEDFQLAFVTPVPSQRSALGYLERTIRLTPHGKIYVGGHSKGGNLAVYAAAMLPKREQDRVFAVYSHDGPGFPASVLSSPGFAAVSMRIYKTVPESSLIGMLLEQQEAYRVVKSSGRDGIEQHDPYSWVVEDFDFVQTDKLSPSALYFDATLSDWIAGLDTEHMRIFTDALFGMLEATGSKIVDKPKLTDLFARANYMRGMDPEMRNVFRETIEKLIENSIKNLFPQRDEEEEPATS